MGVRRVMARKPGQAEMDPGLSYGDKGNIAGAFLLRRAGPLRGRDIILVDDLVTTGETASACCRVLEAAEPSSITILCAGRKRPEKI